jgi:thiamine pyrophosphate-dependent acetolactate synthase large subunit-like protein
MKRHQAIKAIADCYKNAYFIGCNGLVTRELYAINDGPHNFYVLGSMGLPPAIGLGIALAKPNKKIIVITGDGNQLMSLGTLATIGKTSPKNFVEIVLDNECYETTGGQETSSSTTKFSELAKNSGFKHSEYVDTLSRLKAVLKKYVDAAGPILIHAKVGKEKACPVRADIDPYKTKKKFMKALTTDQSI